jgi:hypothetical protein
MDVEVVRFAGQQVRFELTSRRPGLTTMRAIYRGQLVKRLDLPGDPAPLAATFRERARTPVDVMTLVSRMGIAA